MVAAEVVVEVESREGSHKISKFGEFIQLKLTRCQPLQLIEFVDDEIPISSVKMLKNIMSVTG